MKTALIFGAGGFIASHLVNRLKKEGYWVRGVDLKYPEFSKSQADEFLILDLRLVDNVFSCVRLDTDLTWSYLPKPFSKPGEFDEVYQLAADMGGAGYVFTGDHDADIMHNSATINLNLLDALREQKFRGKVFYSSSACMYPAHIQQEANNQGLKESDAYPGNPDSEYGWEKLFSERLYLAYARNYGLNIRIARFHNIYGPEGTYKGGREKAPAAICRKVIEAGSYGGFFIWGDGKQTRSFLFIDDCVDAVRLLMQSDFKEPINIGSEEMVTINELAELAVSISKKVLSIAHQDGPLGVRGRNSNNDLIRKVLNWEPKYTLHDGLEKTFNWIEHEIRSKS